VKTDDDWDDDEPEDEDEFDDRDAWYRDRIDVAFKSLEEQGFIARACFMCCSGCAGSAVCCEVEEMKPEARAKVKGLIYYHQQDADSAHGGYGGHSGDQPLYIRFGPLNTAKEGTVGLTAKEVGNAARTALRASGLKVKWNGSTGTCIRVVP
jgi:hypothetical protein